MEFNVLIGNTEEHDKELFFADSKGTFIGDFFYFPFETQYPQLLKALGIFPSTSEARRCGWAKEIELGFTFPFKIGKLKHIITILKIKQSHENQKA